MQLRSRAWLGLLTLVLAVPAVVSTGVGPAAAAGVPHLDSVTPNTAYVGGSFPVTISGSNLTGTTSVNLGARTFSSVVVVDDSTITAMTPALGAFIIPTFLTVTSPGGTSNALPFTLTFTAPAPVVTAITPASGRLSGNDLIAITGTWVNSGTSVTFGGVAATISGGNGSGEIDVRTPAHAAGAVDVVVTASGGSTTVTNGYTYLNAPTVTAVSPNVGLVGGGTSVTITGTTFTGATAVRFGTTAAASFTVDSSSSITATSPAHAAGVAHVTVTTPVGTSSATSSDQFTFGNGPVVTALSPRRGLVGGGTSVTITGTTLTGATAVRFGATAAASFTVNSTTSITATSPAHAAAVVDVTVTTPLATSAAGAADEFTFGDVPTVSAVSPNLGLVTGGTSVTITGRDLDGATAVMFGSSAASSFTVDSSTSITATSPAHSAAPVDITVVTQFGTSTPGPVDAFTYGDLPTVSGVSPTQGSDAGGVTVTIIGTDLTGATAVLFGSTPAPMFTVDSSTTITATSPAHLVGVVSVTVVGPFGASLSSTPDDFTYAAPAPPPPTSICCRMVTGAGNVFAASDAQLYGNLRGQHLGAPVVGIAPTPSGKGYWFVSADGGVFAFGDASFFGSLGGRDLGAPIVAMAATPDGGGYWLAAADGGVFAFGDARLAGSMSGRHLNAPIVGMSASATGYLLVAADGGVFAFGETLFFGSMGAAHLNAPVVGIAATTSGYLLVGFDGGVFAFGAAPMFGSMSGETKGRAIIGIAAAGDGYLLAARDGVRFSFTAGRRAVASSTTVDAPIVGIG